MCLCEIAVIIQYRLAAFGLLPTPTFSNGAITDARSALQWVQRSIHLFGGDPGRVTIWGQSSGGGTILHLLAAEARSKDAPLWRSSIVSSPYLVPMGKCDTGYFKVRHLSTPISSVQSDAVCLFRTSSVLSQRLPTALSQIRPTPLLLTWIHSTVMMTAPSHVYGNYPPTRLRP